MLRNLPPTGCTTLASVSSRNAWTLVLLIVLPGCVQTGGDIVQACLEEHPGDVRCCFPGPHQQLHIDNGFCCPEGMHTVSDVEHPDWRICIFDADAGGDAR